MSVTNLRTRLERLEQTARPIDTAQRQRIQEDVVAELPAETRAAWNRLVDWWTETAPTRPFGDDAWPAICARPADERAAALELMSRCKERERLAGMRP